MNASYFLHLEKIFKGVANRKRIAILFLLERKPGMSVWEVSERLSLNYMTTSDHLRTLFRAGLVIKSKKFNEIFHTLSRRGLSILEFCKIPELNMGKR